MTGIKYVYTTLTTLWKYFHYSPKRAESLKEIQHDLYLPEMKVIKPSDTRWLSHEWCVKAVKVSYTAIVASLDSNYQNFLKLWDYTRLYPSSPPLQPLSTGLHFTIGASSAKVFKQIILICPRSLLSSMQFSTHWMMPLLQ